MVLRSGPQLLLTISKKAEYRWRRNLGKKMDPDKPIHPVSERPPRAPPGRDGATANDKPRQGAEGAQQPQPRQAENSRAKATPPIFVFVGGFIAGAAILLLLNVLFLYPSQQLVSIRDTPAVSISSHSLVNPSQTPEVNQEKPATMSSTEQT